LEAVEARPFGDSLYQLRIREANLSDHFLSLGRRRDFENLRASAEAGRMLMCDGGSYRGLIAQENGVVVVTGEVERSA
jgi:hypothetical protein